MSDAAVLALLVLAVGGAQALALFQLNGIWRELRELRARIEGLEDDVYRRNHATPPHLVGRDVRG